MKKQNTSNIRQKKILPKQKRKPPHSPFRRSQSEKFLPVKGRKPISLAAAHNQVGDTTKLTPKRRINNSSYTAVQPSTRRVYLKFASPEIAVTSAGGGNTWLYPVTINDAFTPDSFLGAPFNKIPQFAEMASLYASYIVHSVKGSATICPTVTVTSGAQSWETFLLFGNVAAAGGWGAAAGGSIIPDLVQFYSDGPPGLNSRKTVSFGSSGSASSTHHFNHRVSKITGESVTLPGYKSLTNAGPALSVFMGIGFYGPAANLTVSANLTYELIMEVEFLDYVDSVISNALTVAKNGTGGWAKCAACEFLSLKEFEPCICGTIEECGECPYSRPCTLDYPVADCPNKLVKIPVIPVLLCKRLSQSKFIKKKQLEIQRQQFLKQEQIDRDLLRQKEAQANLMESFGVPKSKGTLRSPSVNPKISSGYQGKDQREDSS